MYRFKGAHITPRAAVSIDHGRLVRNLISSSRKIDGLSVLIEFFGRIGLVEQVQERSLYQPKVPITTMRARC